MGKKKIKRKIKIKIIPILIALLIIGVVSGLIYYFSLISISNIYIKGNKYLTDQEIIENAKLENYPSFIKTTSSMIKSRVNKNPYIKSVKVIKKLPRTVVIKVEEYNILFRKEESNKIVLENGNEIDDNNEYNVPILLNYIPDTKYASFLKQMNRVNDSSKAEISEIRYYPNAQDDDRFLLHMNDGNLVYLTLTKFSQINYYKDVVDQLEGKKGILFLDSGNHFKIMEE